MLKAIRRDDLRIAYAKRLTLLALLAGIFFVASKASSEDARQQVFATPEAAGSALVAAGRADDMKALSAILGPDGQRILSSGDSVADNQAREVFVRRYDEMHRFAYNDQGQVVLYIGAENWPVPTPLIKKDGGWIFDTKEGEDEILYRRIGRNELFTIGVLEDLVDAQGEYAEAMDQFAGKIASDPGKKNGLYWKAAPGEPESPIGPLIASATAEGYEHGKNGAPIAFHGYYYRVITKQGSNAPGGAKDYLVDGKMINGFAFIAYPAEYRSSGVMTFMVNQDDVIVQKDLGPETTKVAEALNEFNPDETWDEVFDE